MPDGSWRSTTLYVVAVRYTTINNAVDKRQNVDNTILRRSTQISYKMYDRLLSNLGIFVLGK